MNAGDLVLLVGMLASAATFGYLLGHDRGKRQGWADAHTYADANRMPRDPADRAGA